MESGIFYQHFENNDTVSTIGPPTPSRRQDEEKAQKCRGSRCLVLTTVCLGIICVLLLVFNILQYIFITAERESLFKSHKNTVEEFNQTINRLQANYTENKLKLETRVNNLTAEKKQLQNSFDTLSKKKMELETRVSNLTAEKGQLQNSTNSLSQKKVELETRVNNLTAEKGQLQKSFDTLSQKKLELENRVSTLTAEKGQLQNSINSLNQKKVELESKVTSLSDELKKAYEKGYQWGSGWFFVSSQLSWSDSRQYCRDREADLVIINSEEKQRFITSLVKERVWIGLTDIQQEGNMKWVDNSPLRQGFWYTGEPNDLRNEDCIELIPSFPVMNWNDMPCSYQIKGICEK